MLQVPDHLNRNAPSVQEMGHPADTGAMLIDYMCQRIGIDTLASRDVLDLGCGVRFSQAIIDRDLPIGTYTGIDVDRAVIDFLSENVDDERFCYHYMDVGNQFYNPEGDRLDPETQTALGDRNFDIACMFSVITHQQPEEASAIFRFLRHYIRNDGRLFFSAFLHQEPQDFKELNPSKPGLKASYSKPLMAELLRSADWKIESLVDPLPNDVPIMWSYLCSPVA